MTVSQMCLKMSQRRSKPSRVVLDQPAKIIARILRDGVESRQNLIVLKILFQNLKSHPNPPSHLVARQYDSRTMSICELPSRIMSSPRPRHLLSNQEMILWHAATVRRCFKLTNGFPQAFLVVIQTTTHITCRLRVNKASLNPAQEHIKAVSASLRTLLPDAPRQDFQKVLSAELLIKKTVGTLSIASERALQAPTLVTIRWVPTGMIKLIIIDPSHRVHTVMITMMNHPFNRRGLYQVISGPVVGSHHTLTSPGPRAPNTRAAKVLPTVLIPQTLAANTLMRLPRTTRKVMAFAIATTRQRLHLENTSSSLSLIPMFRHRLQIRTRDMKRVTILERLTMKVLNLALIPTIPRTRADTLIFFLNLLSTTLPSAHTRGANLILDLSSQTLRSGRMVLILSLLLRRQTRCFLHPTRRTISLVSARRCWVT